MFNKIDARSKVICCGSPIIHPLFLRDVSVITAYPNLTTILKDISKSKPKLFFEKSQVLGKNCLQLCIQNRSNLASEDWFQKLVEKSKRKSPKLWSTQPQHFLLQEPIL